MADLRSGPEDSCGAHVVAAMLARAGRTTQVERKRAPGARGVAERAAYEEAVGPIEAAVEARLEAEVNPDAPPVATFQLKRDSVVRRLT